jgi:hypothetical protein
MRGAGDPRNAEQPPAYRKRGQPPGVGPPRPAAPVREGETQSTPQARTFPRHSPLRLAVTLTPSQASYVRYFARSLRGLGTCLAVTQLVTQ